MQGCAKKRWWLQWGQSTVHSGYWVYKYDKNAKLNYLIWCPPVGTLINEYDGKYNGEFFCFDQTKIVCVLNFSIHLIFNRPGVAGVGLQTPPLLGYWLITDSTNLQNIITPKPRELENWNFERMFTPNHMSHVRCHVSRVIFFWTKCWGFVFNGAYPI